MVVRRIRGDNFGHANLSVLHSKFKLESGGTGLGIKYPQPKFSAGLTLADFAPDSNYRKTLPGLLREPGSITGFNCW